MRNIDAVENGPELPKITNADHLKSVELFGCPGWPSFLVEDYPTNIYLAGGRWLEDEGRVLVCGGVYSETRTPPESDIFENMEECYYWAPAADSEPQWVPAPSLQTFKFAHIIGETVDPLLGTNAIRVPVVVGQGKRTEIFRPNATPPGWYAFQDLNADMGITAGCLAQYGDYIYHVSPTEVLSLNTTTWIVDQLAATPDFLSGDDLDQKIGKCAVVELTKDDEWVPGIFLRSGYWFNIRDNTWETPKMFPPSNLLALEADAMFSFHGRPTIFGSPECSGDGTCLYHEVLQYNSVDDNWLSIGRLTESR